MGAVAGKLATIAVAPPTGGATIIPPYCASDASTYLTPFTGAAYNGDAAAINTVTTDFGTTLNGQTLAASGTTYTRADYGLNSYHAMTSLTGLTTSGTYAGNVMRFATANKPNVSGKNVIFHGSPYLPVDIQTTDSVALTGAMGVTIGLCSTANVDYKWWHVAGAGTPWGVARAPLVINTSNTSGVIQSTGTLDATSIYSIGLAVSGKNVAPDWVFGSVWALDTTVVAGGNSSEPVGVDGIVETAAIGHERMSVIQQGASQMLVLQPLQIGNGGTNPTYLELDSTAIEFPRQYDKTAKQVNYCSVDNIAGLTYYAGSSDTIIHKNSVISSPNKYHWQFHASSSTSATYDFSGLQVIGAGTISLVNNLALSGITWSGCSGFSSAGAYLDTCWIENSTATSALTVSSATNMSRLTNLTFTNNTSGHSVELTSTGTYTFDNIVFVGGGAGGTTTADVYNNSGGAITINVTGNGSIPSVRNSAGSSTTINNTVNLSVTTKDSANNNIAGATVAIYQESDLTQLMNTMTNASGVASTTFNYTIDTPIIVRVRKSSAGGTRYVPINTSGTITNSGFSLTVNMVVDTIANAT